MRLSEEEVLTLKKTVGELSPGAVIYLFGSRTEDEKRGGDIDLLIVSKSLTRQDLRKIRLDFFQKFGEQKMDIILDDGSFTDPFHKLIYQKAIRL